ncbi:MYB DNA-binding domain-containing protein [Marssonina coronariae]|uniref:MYB DNA-binding domain-containing protein n=1 Tax=Diplocarpon coronariae TaxID=2795749 RepID=A0A218ZF56_9HELO|nr:MYB DNA-binding domain-containing protein [Diplocarpon mali]OWP06721.1 MYB DNA-binding domain-containing protein [Marssonina coronariae]
MDTSLAWNYDNKYIAPRMLENRNSKDLLEPGVWTPLEETERQLLPKLHEPYTVRLSDRPIPLEPDASTGNGEREPSLQSHSTNRHSHARPIPPADDRTFKSIDVMCSYGDSKAERGVTSRQDLQSILEPSAESMGSSSLGGPSPRSNKTESGKKEDFVQLPQLPQPLRKPLQKPLIPPMFAPLHQPPEPPPKPMGPIAASSFYDSHGRNSLNIVLPQSQVPDINVRVDLAHESEHNETDGLSRPESGKSPNHVPSQAQASEVLRTDQPNSYKAGQCEMIILGQQKPKQVRKRNPEKPRRPWTDLESDALIKGVSQYGLGVWSEILSDTALRDIFAAKSRTSTDLKDRWRTLCPRELRTGSTAQITIWAEEHVANNKQQLSNNPSTMTTPSSGDTVEFPSTKTSEHKQKGRRSQQKTMEDVKKLGIVGPLKPSGRRERIEFTAEEDKAILEGFYCHGAQWAAIQKDHRFNLQKRQPTDLRDRMRNKYPHLIGQSKKRGCSTKQYSTQGRKKSPRTEQPPLPASAANTFLPDIRALMSQPMDQLPDLWVFDQPWLEAESAEPIGENGLSGNVRQDYTAINSIISSSSDMELGQINALQNFNSMSQNEGHMGEMSESSF